MDSSAEDLPDQAADRRQLRVEELARALGVPGVAVAGDADEVVHRPGLVARGAAAGRDQFDDRQRVQARPVAGAIENFQAITRAIAAIVSALGWALV